GLKLNGEPAASPEPANEALDELTRWYADSDIGRRYAKVCGDYNPIHLSALSAKALGMPAAIAHGIYLAARALAGIEPANGTYHWSIEFKTPVVLPASVDLAFQPQADGYKVHAWNARKSKPHFELDLVRS
ncbi:MAG: MaoC/PaaZ C-terminal domain-containing protein, partial [Glutamicibacter sp.]